MQRTKLGLAVVVLLAIVVLLAVWRTAPDASSAPQPANDAAVAPAAASSPTTPAGEGPSAVVAGRQEEERARGSGADLLPLEVRSRETGELVPFAELEYGPLPEEGSERAPPDRASPRGIARVPAAARRRATADADGRAALPGAIAADLLVTGARDGLYGEVVGSLIELQLQGHCVLWLARDASVRVQVVDAAGTPQPGVGVVLGHDVEAGAGSVPLQQFAGTTDAAGMLLVEHCQQLRLVQVGDPPKVRSAFAAVAAAAVSAADGVAFDPRQPPPAPLRLLAPACGRVVVAADPELVRGQQAQLQRADDPSPFAASEAPFGADGTAVFERVRAGGLALRVSVPRLWRLPAREGTGPLHGGDEVRVELPPPANALRVRARLLRGEGPVAGKAVRLRLALRTGGERARTLQADEAAHSGDDGRCAFLLDGKLRDAQLVWGSLRCESEVPALQVLLADRALAGGEVDLGDLQLLPLPVLFAGEVVLDDGEPCPQAILNCLPVEEEAVPYAPPRNLVREQIDRSGNRFTIYGQATAAKYILTAHFPSLGSSGEVECEAGARDLRLTIARAAQVEAFVRTPEPWRSAAEAFLAELLPVPGGGAANRCRGFPDVDPGEPRRVRVRFLNVAAGRYDLLLRASLQPNIELLRLGGIDVRPGVLADPRLQSLAISGREVVVEATDATGQPLVQPVFVGVVQRLPDGRLGGWHGRRGIGGAAVAVVGDAEAWVAAPGFAPCFMPLDRPRVHVALQPATRRVAVRTNAPPLPGGVQLALACTPQLDLDLPQYTSGGQAEFDSSGWLTVDLLGLRPSRHELAADGPTDLTLPCAAIDLRLSLQRGDRSVDVAGISPARLAAAAASSSPTVCELTAGPAARQAALAALDAR